MILLHHPEVALSRELLAANPEGVEVVDWTDEQAVSAFSGPSPSAFPSVVVDVPAYAVTGPLYDEDGAFQGMGPKANAARQEVLRLPASWEAVEAYVAYVAGRATANPVE